MNIDPTDAVNSEQSFVTQVKAGGQIPPIPSRILSRILELPTWYPAQMFEWNPVNPTYNSEWDPVLIYRWDAFSARYNSRRDPAPPPQKSWVGFHLTRKEIQGEILGQPPYNPRRPPVHSTKDLAYSLTMG